MKLSKSKKHRSFPTVTVIAIALTSVFCAGAGAGFVFTQAQAPQELQIEKELSASSFPVASEELTDSVSASLIFTMADETPLVMSHAGKITRTTCVPGQKIKSGKSPITLDDTALLALHTSEPLWRDLKLGSRGSDVVSLQKELQNLGFDVTTDGVFGENTKAAIKSIQATELKQLKPSGVLSIDQTIWLPSRTVSILSCSHKLGTQATQDFGTVKGALKSAKLHIKDPISLAGPRTVSLVNSPEMTVEASVDEAITDREFLSAVVSDPAYQVLKEDEGSEFLVNFSLQKPVKVISVPPGALFGITGTQACVVSNGEVVPVNIVSSSFGKAHVETATAQELSNVTLSYDYSEFSCAS